MKVFAHRALLAFFAWTACGDRVDFETTAPYAALPLVIDGSLTSGENPFVVLSMGYPTDGPYHVTRVKSNPPPFWN